MPATTVHKLRPNRNSLANPQTNSAASTVFLTQQNLLPFRTTPMVQRLLHDAPEPHPLRNTLIPPDHHGIILEIAVEQLIGSVPPVLPRMARVRSLEVHVIFPRREHDELVACPRAGGPAIVEEHPTTLAIVSVDDVVDDEAGTQRFGVCGAIADAGDSGGLDAEDGRYGPELKETVALAFASVLLKQHRSWEEVVCQAGKAFRVFVGTY